MDFLDAMLTGRIMLPADHAREAGILHRGDNLVVNIEALLG
jgi:hypothetical protein